MKKIYSLITIVATLTLLSNSAVANASNPFTVGGTSYPTLQEAVDAANDGSVITVAPGVYDYTYATNNGAYKRLIPSNNKYEGLVFLRGKSLTIKNQNTTGQDYKKKDSYTATLDGFVFVIKGRTASETATEDHSITLDNLCLTGQSLIIADTWEGSIKRLTLNQCYIDVSNPAVSDKNYSFKQTGIDSGTHTFGAAMGGNTTILAGPRNGGNNGASLTELSATKNTLIARGGARTFYFGMRLKYFEAAHNVIGAPDDDGRIGWCLLIDERSHGCEMDINDNIQYTKYDGQFVYFNTDKKTSLNYIVKIHDNKSYTADYIDHNNRKRSAEGGSLPKLVYFVPNITNYNPTGKIAIYKNYINDYCNNVAQSMGSSFTVDVQDGHTDGDGHIHELGLASDIVKKYGIKQEDIYLLNKADAFDGGTHIKRDLGTTYYCDRCDPILTPLTISCTGLVNGEAAMFDIKDSEGTVIHTIALIDNGEGSVQKTVIGLVPGQYTVAPNASNWQWTYSTPSPVTKTLKSLEQVTEKSEFTYNFTLSKKTGITIKNGESSKVNELEGRKNPQDTEMEEGDDNI